MEISNRYRPPARLVRVVKSIPVLGTVSQRLWQRLTRPPDVDQRLLEAQRSLDRLCSQASIRSDEAEDLRRHLDSIAASIPRKERGESGKGGESLDDIRRILVELQMKVDRLAESSVSCYVGDRSVLTRVQGFKMLLPSDDISLTPHLMLDGNWEQWVTDVFLRSIKPGMIVVDVGANVGYYTLLGARATGPTGRVLAFEPEPRNLRYLRHNVELAGAHWVTISSKGLWNQSGSSELYIRSEDQCGGHSMIGGGDGRKVIIETITLDEFLRDNLRVDVIKMDAERAEPFIIEGMTNVIAANPNLKILMEFSPDMVRDAGRDPQEYLRSLRELRLDIKFINHDATLSEVNINRIESYSDLWPEMLLLERV